MMPREQRRLFSHGIELLEGGYERMFPRLEPLEISDAAIKELATTMVTGPVAPENPFVPAGYTYFGQFVAHDLSRMRVVPGSPNLRIATLNLDTVYGADRAEWQHLFVKNAAHDDVFKFERGASPTTGKATREPDLVRNGLKADIPDSRNDIHIIISQFHLAFMRLHNKLTEKLRVKQPLASNDDIYRAARQQVCWHYQWLVVNEYLHRICDLGVLEAAWPTRNTLHPSFMPAPFAAPPKVPYEFVLAAYRFGHSMVRRGYQLNYQRPTDTKIFRAGAASWQGDLRGDRKLPPKWSVQWDLFFQVPGGAPPQQARCIGPSLTNSLGHLPDFVIADDADRDRLVNLAERTLRIGRDRCLPSGQAVARELAANVFPNFGIAAGEVLRPEQQDPLWYYILDEARNAQGGQRLGPVGSWIVASTIAKVLLNDPTSFIRQTDWQPHLPRPGADFEVADLIRYAGMPMNDREWDAYVGGSAQ